jgi:hypothetical protein
MSWCIFKIFSQKLNSLFSTLTLTSALFLTFSSCNNNPVIPKDPEFSLTAEDASCIEAWLSLKTNNAYNVNLFRNDSLIMHINTTAGTDTTILDEGLHPSQNYTYRAEVSIENRIYSRETVIRTMDTTSHNFTWQKWEFGDIGSSVLYDVAIIDENNIWAVGEIYISDTSENGHTVYNAVHWDGSDWKLYAVQYNKLHWPIRTIFAFSESEIWFSAFVKYDGHNFKEILYTTDLIGWEVYKIWGENSNNLYAVGTSGKIAHYNGNKWTKIESGTEYNLNDIWGDYNEKTGEWEILAAGGNILEDREKIILKIDGYSASVANNKGTNWPLSTILFTSPYKYYVAGSGIYIKGINQNNWNNNPHDITTYTISKIRGKTFNDMAASGGVGEVLHFNGVSWRSYFQHTNLAAGNYLGVSIQDRIIVAVGSDNLKAIITIGKRN